MLPQIGFNTTRGAAKKFFFDRPAVQKLLDKKTLRYLRRVGGFTRLAARRSIRRRRGVSAPGQPPSSHTGLLRSGILFSLNPRDESVVIGPTLSNTAGDGGSAGTVPALLEFGGVVARPATAGRKRKVERYRARPYMGPALQKAADPGRTKEFWGAA